ncbi:hypothetical protein ACTG1Q_23875 [Aeromonas dhakensis]|uniref:hypothetical protein n=1 Tax=Aeromonas dhakensis TaxID=196024 RepID=UPI003F7A424E
MRFYKHGIEVDGGCIWLLDAGGQRLCDLTEMQLLDFGGRISVEGGLLNFDLKSFFKFDGSNRQNDCFRLPKG